MTTNTTSKASEVVATMAVVDKLACANESAITADKFAREAAIIADENDYITAPPTERLESILALYKTSLTHKAVKESFSAALAILIADKPVRIAASAKTEKATGQVTFTAPEALPPVAVKHEILPEGKAVTEMSPTDALAKLTTGVMKQAATAAREALGVARAKGGGRKASQPEGRRAPFYDELGVALRDAGMMPQCLSFIELAASNHVPLKNAIIAMAKRLNDAPKKPATK